jgi:hypothetical protein
MSEKDFAARLDVPNRERQLQQLETQMRAGQNAYAAAATNVAPMRKVEFALQHNLSQKALEVLTDAPSEISSTGAQVALKLLIGSGRIKEAREVLDGIEERGERGKLGHLTAEHRTYEAGFGRGGLGMPAFEWFAFQAAAAAGDYDDADATLANAIKQVPRADSFRWDSLKLVRDLDPQQIEQTIWMLRSQHLADLWAMRALMSLEAGHVSRAAEQARWSMALSLTLPAGQGSRDVAEVVLELTGGKKKKR